MMVKGAGKYLSRYLKRVRKAGVSLRYLAVPELHKSGLVHWHLLVHSNCTYRQLAQPWRYGFSNLRLVDGAKGIRYATKYLSKAKMGRVRSSLGYGASPDANALLA
jgi:hypothetical protein